MKKIFSFFVLYIAIYLISCNDKPADLAVNLLPDTVTTKGISTFDTLLIPSIRVYKAKYPIFNLGSIFIGKANGISSVSLSNFAYLPDTLGYVTEDKIESAKLEIYPKRYAMGDTVNSNLSFDIYRVIRAWSPDTTNYDSLIVSPANYFGEKIGTYQGSIALKDTMEVITFDLPKSMIAEWLKTTNVYDTTKKDSVPKRIPNWGIAYVPKEGTNVMNSFAGSKIGASVLSKITVKYKDKSDTTRALNLEAGIDVSFLDAEKPSGEDIVIWNGLNYWTEIQFDLSMIPRFSGIHKAQLDLFLNKDKSFKGNNNLDSIIEANFFWDPDGESTFQYLALSDSTGKFRFTSLTSTFQLWNKYDGKGSIVFMPHNTFNQANELDKLVFYGINAIDTTKRPQLRVIYSLNPSNFK